jgi:hypothetical protein
MTVTTAAVATWSAFAGFMVPFPTFALFSPRRAQRTRTRPAAHHPSRAGVLMSEEPTPPQERKSTISKVK